MIPSQDNRFQVDGFFIRDNEFDVAVPFRICLKKFAKREQKMRTVDTQIEIKTCRECLHKL